MGIAQPFDLDIRWDQAARVLDETFPLTRGSHRDAADYLVQQGHLLVIDTQGGCTGLASPGQFHEADEDDDAPQLVVLQHEGVQVEIEPSRRRSKHACGMREHRMRMQAEMASV